MVVGTVMEIVGYGFRARAHKDPYSIINFVVQYFFIVVAPVFFSASIYTILSKMINVVGRQYSPIPPRLLLVIFISSDIIATIVQVAGAALVGSAESNRKDPTTPNNILLAGLAFQCFTFAMYMTLLSVFLWRARKMAETMMGFVAAFVTATLAVYLRTVFRLAETAQGLNHSLSSHEVYFGCLEFAPIVVAVLILNAFHPGKYVPRVA